MKIEKWNEKLVFIALSASLIWLAVFLIGWIGEGIPKLSHVIWPILLAWFLRILLLPLVQKLEYKGMPRKAATIVVFVTIGCFGWVAFLHAWPVMTKQWNLWTEFVPQVTLHAQQIIDDINQQNGEPTPVQRGLSLAVDEANQWISDWIRGLLSRLPETISGFLLVLMVPFLLYYFLSNSLSNLFNHSQNRLITILKKCHPFFAELENLLGGYIRGQLIVCVIVGISAYVSYLIFHVPNAFMLAVFVALFNIIPYIGPLISLIPALLIASTVSFQMMIYVVLINLICQVLEGYIVAPWVLSKTIDLHPIWVMISLLIAAEVWGIWGLLLAVPILIVLKVVYKHLLIHFDQLKINI